jgi:choline transport protein
MLSLAEMASMAPTAGGQYHWVSEFSPPSLQKPLSFFVGWMSTLSWQAGTASGPFLVGTLIQASVIVMYPNYEPKSFHGTLMVIAVTMLVWALNVWGTKSMPMFQNVMLLIHVFGFLTVIIVFWVLSPRASAEVTFTQFSNGGGWSSIGLTLMVGQLSAIYACICKYLDHRKLLRPYLPIHPGSDSAAHMSEEIKDAGKTVPRAMIGAYLMNGSLGIVFLVSYMFMITDVTAALEDASGYPHIWVFSQSVGKGGVVALNTIPIVLIFAGTLTYNLSTSRQTWAFARDNGLPFSSWIGKVNKRLDTPANSVTVTCAITIGLSVINLGSDTAFNASTSFLLSLLTHTTTTISNTNTQ